MATSAISEGIQSHTPKWALVRRAIAIISVTPYRKLLLILLISLPFRMYWMLTHTPVLNADGSEYVRMAENLATGRGLVGNFEGPETMYTPLFSILTAGVYLFVRHGELAAHLVSLVFGVVLIIPIFLIARTMYGERVAQISALIIALNPLFIKLSGSVFNENVYLFFLLLSIYLGLRCLESPSKTTYALLGLCLGFAYLTRPEAFIYPVCFVIMVCITGVWNRKIAWQSAMASLLIVGVFVIVALPYVYFLYAHTGHLRLEGKWNINYTIANRIRAGMDYVSAAYGLDANDSVAGPLLDPYHFAAYTPYSQSWREKGRTLFAMAAQNSRPVYDMLWSSPIGSPCFVALAVIGLFRKAWNRRRLMQEAVLLFMAASILFLLTTASLADFRYMLPFVAIASLWVGNGIAELTQWSRVGRALVHEPLLPTGRVIGITIPVVLLSLMLAIVLFGTRGLYFFASEDANYLDVKQAGMWVRTHSPESSRILCNSTVLTYYAKATAIELPYAPSTDALKYVRSKNPDLIVLDQRDSRTFPEVQGWLEHGISDPRAELLYKSDNGTNLIEIFRWYHR